MDAAEKRREAEGEEQLRGEGWENPTFITWDIEANYTWNMWIWFASRY